MEQYIENLKNAQDEQTIRLNSSQGSLPIPHQFWQGGKKQFCPILPF